MIKKLIDASSDSESTAAKDHDVLSSLSAKKAATHQPSSLETGMAAIAPAKEDSLKVVPFEVGTPIGQPSEKQPTENLTVPRLVENQENSDESDKSVDSTAESAKQRDYESIAPLEVDGADGALVSKVTGEDKSIETLRNPETVKPPAPNEEKEENRDSNVKNNVVVARNDFIPVKPAIGVRNNGLAFSAAIGLFASVLFMLMLGWFADFILGSQPWGLVGGVVLGALIGLVQFVRTTSRIVNPRKPVVQDHHMFDFPTEKRK